MPINTTNQNIILYKWKDGSFKLEVHLENETVWLSQKQMAELFDVEVATINEHLKNIYESEELSNISTIRNFLTVQKEWKRNVQREIKYYNLDVIISLWYRVNSIQATHFRQWATQRLKEYIIKGWTIDDERLKWSWWWNYWKELLDRIRDIRSSEKALYRQVLDLYATSVDYNKDAPESIEFFKIVQNKLHYASSQNTAAELIYHRADAKKDFMGLTTFAGAMPTLAEVQIAKNYLTEDELFRLNRMVSAFFDLAEIKAQEHQEMRMKDWIFELDKFTTMYWKGTLKDWWTITHDQAIEKAIKEYRTYQSKTLSPVEKDYLENIKVLQKTIEKKQKKK